MSLDYTKLVSQGRAKNPGKCWETHELDALITLERERGLSRITAADFIRNGILTLEQYDEAVAVKFEPKTQEEAQAEAERTLAESGPKTVKAKRASKKI
jgi:hypothetical protein